jgi:hypothetical protein
VPVESGRVAVPTRGGDPTVAWTCAVVAALIEMASTIAVRDDESSGSYAREPRQHALELADTDIAVYKTCSANRRNPANTHPALRALPS